MLQDDRQRAEAALERSKSVLEGDRAELQRARDDLDRFSARVRGGRRQSLIVAVFACCLKIRALVFVFLATLSTRFV